MSNTFRAKTLALVDDVDDVAFAAELALSVVALDVLVPALWDYLKCFSVADEVAQWRFSQRDEARRQETTTILH